MANQTIKVPPPEGGISLNVNDQLTIDAAKECQFCCSIGANFSPNISNITLNKGNNGPYTANTVGSGMYNTSEKGNPCSPEGPTLTAKSVQIG